MPGNNLHMTETIMNNGKAYNWTNTDVEDANSPNWNKEIKSFDHLTTIFSISI